MVTVSEVKSGVVTLNDLQKMTALIDMKNDMIASAREEASDGN